MTRISCQFHTHIRRRDSSGYLYAVVATALKTNNKMMMCSSIVIISLF